LVWSRVFDVVYSAHPDIHEASGLTLNGLDDNVTPPRHGLVKVATLTVGP
jgi:hypothetical protein